MTVLQRLTGKPRTVREYIRSIGRYYTASIAGIIVIIGLTGCLIGSALERHALQERLTFLIGRQFFMVEQLSDQLGNLAATSSSQSPVPDNTRLASATKAIDGIADMASQINMVRRALQFNLVTYFERTDESEERLQGDLSVCVQEFLVEAESLLASTSSYEDQPNPLESGTCSYADRQFIGVFDTLLQLSDEHLEKSIEKTRYFGSSLLCADAIAVVLAGALLFRPLLRKLRRVHHQTIRFQRKLSRMAHTDELTGLANRLTFKGARKEFIERFQSNGSAFSLLLIDLDRFKQINDNFGHQAGDAALVHVGRALQRGFPAPSVPARLGGDEFAVLVPGSHDAESLTLVVEAALREITSEYLFDNRAFKISCSIGGAIAPLHGTDDMELLRIADLALYSAKKGNSEFIVFNESDGLIQLEQNQLSLALMLAVERDEFVVHYQPKFDLLSRRFLGFEALVRWQHPTLGLLSPARFLHLTEGNEIIRYMTRSVIRTVASDLRAWKDRGYLQGPVAINMPEALLMNESGLDMLSGAIAEYGLEWHDFAVEITENVFLERTSGKIRDTIIAFRERGVVVCLDDFGTGYASLVHLIDFPFDALKIDRSFIMSIGNGIQSEQIVRAVIDLARNLGKECIAEGIETDEQRQFLLANGCTIGQGFLFSKPLPSEDIEALLYGVRGSLGDLCAGSILR